MTSSLVDFRREGDVFHVCLNRADKRNALTRSMLTALLEGLSDLLASTRLVVLSGQGTVFCAGMDLQEMQATVRSANPLEIWHQDSDLYRRVVELLFFLPCPTLCVVQGPVLAGGVGLVLACDLVVATEGASVTLPEPKRGITASLVSPLLVQRIGYGPASWLLLSGQTIDARDALRMGIVHRLVESSTLQDEVSGVIATILSGAPEALRATKQQLVEPIAEALRAAWDRAAQQSAVARGQPEAREGLQAFLERRQPSWVPTTADGAADRM